MSYTKPQYIVFAGGNGAGKSTLKYEMLSQGISLGEMIDLDALAKEVGYEHAASILEGEIQHCLENGVTFNQETATPSFLRFKEAKTKGFRTALFFASLDNPDMHVDRVAGRVEQGGHNVSEKIIRSNYENSFHSLAKCIPYIDQLFVFNNTHTMELVLVAENQIGRFKNHHAPKWLDKYVTPHLDMKLARTDNIRSISLGSFFQRSNDDRKLE